MFHCEGVMDWPHHLYIQLICPVIRTHLTVDALRTKGHWMVRRTLQRPLAYPHIYTSSGQIWAIAVGQRCALNTVDDWGHGMLQYERGSLATKAES